MVILRSALVLLAVYAGLSIQPVAASPAQGPSFEHVYIKTPTETFNSRYYYALKDGRIWIRPNAETTGKNEPWTLMGCEGLPCQPDNPEFVVPQTISEISADGDEITVLDDKQNFYARTSAGPGLLSKDEWIMKHGFPKDTLDIPDALKGKRAVSMGRRHFDALWHEDADNNVHHYGTMGTSTIYLLSPEGHEIWYTDNGMPADFSNQICGPERGAFVAENLQASAGTLFVINRAGEMYTHMNDFDLNGGTSMFIDYTYTPQAYRPEDKGTDYKTHLKPWRLPLQNWQQQPAIPLTGQARLSTALTILQTGNGNAARELRVAGQNAGGETGYWFKDLLAEAWQFKVVPLKIAPTAWTDPEHVAPRVKPQDIDYQEIQPEHDYRVELLNFNLHCSPATLRLSYQNQQVDLKLHSIDAWINVRRRDPGRDGTPMLLMSTLEASPEQLQTLPEPFKSLNLQDFAIQVAATSDRLVLFNHQIGVIARLQRVSPIPSSMKTFNYDGQPPLATYTAALFRENHEEYLRLRDHSLLLWDLDKLTRADIPQLDSLIARNQARLQHYTHGYELMQTAENEAWLESFGTALLKNLYQLIWAEYWIPHAKVTSRVAPELLWAYAAVDDELNTQGQAHYSYMIRLIQARIERYQQRKQELMLQPQPK